MVWKFTDRCTFRLNDFADFIQCIREHNLEDVSKLSLLKWLYKLCVLVLTGVFV